MKDSLLLVLTTIQYFSMEKDQLPGSKFKSNYEPFIYHLGEILDDQIRIYWYIKDGHSENGKEWWRIETVLKEIKNGDWKIIESSQSQEVSNYSIF